MVYETDLHTVVFSSEQYGIEPVEYDRLSSFLPESEWRRVEDFWGRRGWLVGRRREVMTSYQGKTSHGHGGQVYIFYDHDQSVGGVHPEMFHYISD